VRGCLRIGYNQIVTTLGERIADARQETHLRQVDLGAQVGVTGRTVSRWETGASAPTRVQLRRIAAALDKPLAYFTDGQAQQVAPEAELAAQFARLVNTFGPMAGLPVSSQSGGPHAGIEALLADEALCRALAITQQDAAYLRCAHTLPVGPATVQEAVEFLQSLRRMSSRVIIQPRVDDGER